MNSTTLVEGESESIKDDKTALSNAWWPCKDAKSRYEKKRRGKSHKTKPRSMMLPSFAKCSGKSIRSSQSIDDKRIKSPDKKKTSKVASMHGRLDRLEELVKILHQRNSEKLEQMRKHKTNTDQYVNVKLDCDNCIPSIEKDVIIKGVNEVKEEEDDDEPMDMAEFQSKDLTNQKCLRNGKSSTNPSWREVVGID